MSSAGKMRLPELNPLARTMCRFERPRTHHRRCLKKGTGPHNSCSARKVLSRSCPLFETEPHRARIFLLQLTEFGRIVPMQNPAPYGASPTHARFGVLGFLCTLSMITYLDRVCISRVQGNIQHDLGFSDNDMGLVFGAFAVGYCLFEVPGGWMGDMWGSRKVLTRIVIWWSLFTALTGSIDQILGGIGLTTPALVLWGMLLVRFLFGCGEAGAYPNAARVVGSWFPFGERGFAQGAIWFSARLGGAVAPFVIGR